MRTFLVSAIYVAAACGKMSESGTCHFVKGEVFVVSGRDIYRQRHDAPTTQIRYANKIDPACYAFNRDGKASLFRDNWEFYCEDYAVAPYFSEVIDEIALAFNDDPKSAFIWVRPRTAPSAHVEDMGR